jgi:protein required for attachment to host cells
VKLKDLQNAVRVLAVLDETEAPFISCYLNREAGESSFRAALDQRIGELRRSLRGEARLLFEEALIPLQRFLAGQVASGTEGIAIFSRGGTRPYFLALQFHVPVPTWVVVDTVPNIYHLVELKDTYHRYVLLLATEKTVRILEVNLGAVTAELWRERPELRKRVGREWTKQHYQSHCRERTHQFVKEEVRHLERLMSAGGHTHLLLAGNPRLLAEIRRSLPKSLLRKLVDVVRASCDDQCSDVVNATLASFIQQEEQESLAAVEKLWRALHTTGLAAIGARQTLEALRQGRVDTLIIAKELGLGLAFVCTICGAFQMPPNSRPVCRECGDARLRRADPKEELVRLAEQGGCQIETVGHSDLLMDLGGVGCLLRYLPPEQLNRRAA